MKNTTHFFILFSSHGFVIGAFFDEAFLLKNFSILSMHCCILIVLSCNIWDTSSNLMPNLFNLILILFLTSLSTTTFWNVSSEFSPSSSIFSSSYSISTFLSAIFFLFWSQASQSSTLAVTWLIYDKEKKVLPLWSATQIVRSWNDCRRGGWIQSSLKIIAAE